MSFSQPSKGDVRTLTNVYTNFLFSHKHWPPSYGNEIQLNGKTNLLVLVLVIMPCHMLQSATQTFSFCALPVLSSGLVFRGAVTSCQPAWSCTLVLWLFEQPEFLWPFPRLSSFLADYSPWFPAWPNLFCQPVCRPALCHYRSPASSVSLAFIFGFGC